jgi:hypothetical protein
MWRAIAFAQLYASDDRKPRSRLRGEHHCVALIASGDLAVPRVPKDTSAAGIAIAAKPLLMAASGDHLFGMSAWQNRGAGTALALNGHRWLPERAEILRGCSGPRRSRTSCCEPQRRLSARPNVGGELTAQAWRLGREAENTQSCRTAKVPCRSGSARLTG